MEGIKLVQLDLSIRCRANVVQEPVRDTAIVQPNFRLSLNGQPSQPYTLHVALHH